MCVDGLMDVSQSRSQGLHIKLFAEFTSPVPCRTGRRTRTWHWASAWRNKLQAIIISRAHPQKIFHHLCDPPPPNFCTARTLSMATNGSNQWWNTEERYWSINQGSEKNRTEIGRPKVINIDYNTVAPSDNQF